MPAVASGPQRQRAAGLVLEREHLLLDDVRGLPHAAREQLGVLEHRRLHRLVARAAEHVVGDLHEPRAAGARPGQHVERAARRLELASPRQLGQERVGRPLGAQRGDAHVARVDGGLARERVDQRRGSTRAACRSRRPAGRCGRSTAGTARRPRRSPARPGSRTSRGRGCGPGVKITSISKPASSSRSPPASVCSASYDSNGPKPGHGTKLMMSASTKASISGTQTSAPVALATGATAPTWSKCVCVSRIAVELDAERVDRAEQLVGLLARIDDQRPVRAVAAEEVGVLRHRPDGEHAHVHQLACLPPCARR